jgi:hypothetical protein
MATFPLFHLLFTLLADHLLLKVTWDPLLEYGEDNSCQVTESEIVQ